MSTISSRPRVSGVVVTAAAGTVVTGAAVACGLLRAIGTASRAIHRELEEVREKGEVEIRPLSTIRAEQQSVTARLELSVRGLHHVDALKLEAAARLSTYVVEDAARLSSPLRALETAHTVQQARDASRALLAAAEAEHRALFSQRLIAAVGRASAASGFHTVVTRIDAGGVTRIMATSESGAALVTEIHSKHDREPRMATEVVGLHDGTCTEIMDRFDMALEAEGVRAAGPHRTFTGGICELLAAREFVPGRLGPENLVTADRPKAPRSKRRRLRNSVARHRRH